MKTVYEVKAILSTPVLKDDSSSMVKKDIVSALREAGFSVRTIEVNDYET